MLAPDMRATGITLRLTTQISPGDEPALYLAGACPDPATTAVKATRGTAAAAAAVRGVAVEVLETEASPGGSTGRDGEIPSTRSDLSPAYQNLLKCLRKSFVILIKR